MHLDIPAEVTAEIAAMLFSKGALAAAMVNLLRIKPKCWPIILCNAITLPALAGLTVWILAVSHDYGLNWLIVVPFTSFVLTTWLLRRFIRAPG